ncbi:RNA-directed DNA polymerase, eukaryota, reverse transcriptase zinc-binding domain protein [Tanacetum coccineum]
MYSVASWNIRGLNWCPKQKEVLQVVNKNNLSVCAILESHVDVLAVYDTCKKVNIRVDNKTLFCSYVYADNYYVDRHALWNNLAGHAGLMRDKSWVLLDCVQRMEVIDVNSSGLHFTWNQKPKGSNGILKKIDMIIGNLQFNDDFSGSFAIFQPYRILDHSSCVLRIPKVVKRLKGLKSLFHKLLHTHGNLNDQVKMLRVELDEVQRAIDRDPSCQSLRDDHAHYLLAFKKASLDEERFLRQKSKVEWLKACDTNTAYFPRVVKSNCARNHIVMFLSSEGTTVRLDTQDLFVRVLDNQKVDVMVRDITDSEIRGALFHDRCDHQRSVNLCFADDLFLFARGHPNSVQVIMHALEIFKNVSGLVPSILKSTAFFVMFLML